MATLVNTPNVTGNSLNNTASKVKSAFSSGIENLDSETRDQINRLKDQAMDKAAAYYEQSEKYVRRNPFYFIGGAAVLGCVAGMLLARKH